MALTLSTLPIEVVELIVHTLEPNQLFSLRLVCKKLHRKTLHPFRTYFTTIRTDLSRKSLQKLQAVSGNAQLQQHVQTLLIIKSEDDNLGRGFQWHRHPSDHIEAPLPGLEKLQDILVHSLPNCRSFRIRSLGGSDNESDDLTPSDAIAIILSIVATTSLPVKSFTVDFGRGQVDAKRLQIWQYRLPSFRNGWSHMRELSVEQSLTSENFDWAIDLIVHATGLRKLSLGFEFDYSASFIERLCSSNALHGLASLRLACAHVTSDKLFKLIVRSRCSLRALSFQHVSIESGGDWPTVLGQLRDQLPLLETISVHWLAGYGRESGTHVMFPSLSSNPVVPGSGGRRFTLTGKRWKGERRIFGVDYQGPGVDKALEILVKAAEYI